MTHFVVIHALMVSWYPGRRPSYLTGDIMLDIDPWRYPCVAEVVKEDHETFFLMKNPMKTWNP